MGLLNRSIATQERPFSFFDSRNMQMNHTVKSTLFEKGLFLAGIAAIGFLGLLAGCGSSSGNLPPLAPVSGKVTLDGNPLPRGTVTFIPDESKGTKGPTAVGQIGPDGQFTLRTAQNAGAVLGHHKVRIRARQEAKSPQEEGKEPSLIPLKYENENTSGLSFEVKSGKNEFLIELHSR